MNRHSIIYRLFGLILITMVPILIVVIYLLVSFNNYSRAYGDIVDNMTIANNYNLNFKEEMDESLYRLAVGYSSFDTIGDDEQIKDPYGLIEELRSEFGNLANITTDTQSASWLKSLLRNIDTLEDRTDDLRNSIERGGQYDVNMEMLENNIYILTDLIQDDIQYYIYYQTRSIENLKNELNSRITSFIIATVILTAAIVLAAVLISGYVVNGITRPVKELCKVTEKIARGEFESRAGVSTNDEIAILAESVNDMARHLQVMVDQIKEDERKMRHAELRLLQEQINPHFLYNTLDTIVWLIETNNNEGAVNMLMSLSEFFRLVLSKGKESITIREEEQHIRSYLEIQQVRYHDILEYSIDIDPNIYDYQILKLTLQPLIENSLYHGIKYKRAKGEIRVTGHKEGENVVLVVEDTGVGMDEETYNRIKEEIMLPSKKREKGFGLANVNERIRMNFGNEYGMKIYSKKDEGTRIEVVIPALNAT